MNELVKRNIYKGLPEEMPEELFSEFLSGDNFKLEKIISKGHITAADYWYNQEQNEWVMLLRGQAVLLFEDNNQKIEMLPGDYIIIPAHKKHKVIYTAQEQHSVWLALHFT